MRLLVVLTVLFPCYCFGDICDDLAEQSIEIKDTSPECFNQLEIMCKNGSLLWRMVDASSKYPISGMLYSSNMDLGTFDECVGINHESPQGEVKGKFCTYGIYVVNPFLDVIPSPLSASVETKSLADLPKENILSDDPLSRNEITDLAFATALSICIPDKCTSREVGKFFVWGSLENTSLLGFSDAIPCVTKDSYTDFDGGEIAFTFFLALIGFFIVCSSVYDFYLRKTGKKIYHPVLLAFSFITNGEKILHVSTGGPEQIHCLNGLRFISMMWVIAGHGFVALKEVPLINYVTLADYQDKIYTQYIIAAPISVDTFFFLSGFLLCFGYLKGPAKQPLKKQLFGIPMMILHRYLRLTPALAVAFFASITIFKKLGLGPLWGIVVHTLKEQCVNHWWQFFLYVQNYTDFKDMCLNHTWYLSADMQMFVLAPIVLIPLGILIKQNRVNLAMVLMGILTVLCVGLPMLSRYIDHTIENVYDAHSRFNDYIIGMMLGVILRHPKFKRFPFGKLTNLAIWGLVLNICVAFILYYHSIIRIYEHTSDTTFYGLYRPIWCASLAWIVYSCYHGYGGPVNWFLSLPVFQIGGRLSYCMYLLHAIVQMYWVGLIRTQYSFGDYINFYTWCGHFIVTLILAAVWSLAFESPMIVIEKFIFGGGRAPPKEAVKK